MSVDFSYNLVHFPKMEEIWKNKNVIGHPKDEPHGFF